MLGEVRRWAFLLRIPRWNIKIETVRGSEQTQCQIDDMFFVWLTCHSLAQQVSELRESIAPHARNRRPPPRVLIHEIINDIMAERALHVQHVVRNPQLLAHAPRVVH